MFLGVLLQTFSQVVIVAQYYAQKDFIARNLCENRSKPQLHCNGKCCLRKKLAKEGREQAPSPRNQKEEQVVNLFFANNFIEIRPLLSVVTADDYFNRNDLRTFSFHHPVFHPPTV
jgi:hypothetical protein